MNKDKCREAVAQLYFEEYGKKAEIISLKGGGSTRRYYRLKKNENGAPANYIRQNRKEENSVVGVWGEDREENIAFISLDHCLEENGIKVPHIIRVSEDLHSYLISDLGDTSLLDVLLDSKTSGYEKIEYAKKALAILVKIQTISEEKWRDRVIYTPFSRRLVMWDLNYFKYEFLKPSEILFDEEKLEDDFEKLAEELMNPGISTGLMYRDFQSRNIMVNEGDLWFIDFQGARQGPMAYDAVSFIWQAKAPFTFEEREELADFYSREVENLGIKSSKMQAEIELMQVFRTLQVLGAYGFRGLIQGKKHFIESIPLALENLNYMMGKGCLLRFPEIERIADELAGSGIFGTKVDKKKKDNIDYSMSPLTLKVFSFSYKKGYPEDKSGNGGGFMFDCRAIHNPGRYAEYKTLTGKNQEVIDFLEATDEAKKFLDNAYNIVKPSIERYIERDFTSLQVGFGCTGGQHRSVYCAEKFYEKVRKDFPGLKVELKHREQS